jgi:hypothetical protein
MSIYFVIRILPWRVAAPLLISLLVFHKPPDIKNLAKVLQGSLLLSSLNSMTFAQLVVGFHRTHNK